MRPAQTKVETTRGMPESDSSGGPDVVIKPAVVVMKRFQGTIDLDPERVPRDAGKIAEEVISHLVGLVGAKVKVTLEIEAEVPAGVPSDQQRIVNENARSLKFRGFGFERE